MLPANIPSWPCPVCAELLGNTLEDCPHCRLPADWLDLMLAEGFAIRQFHYWSVVGILSKQQYRAVMDAAAFKQDAMTRAAQSGERVSPHSGLPSRSACWRCLRSFAPGTLFCGGCNAPLAVPEVRLFRYQTYLRQQVHDHALAGRLSAEQASLLLAETARNLADVKGRLSGGR